MKYSESEISAIVRQVVAKMNLKEPTGANGIFEDMNEAIAAAKAATAALANLEPRLHEIEATDYSAIYNQG